MCQSLWWHVGTIWRLHLKLTTRGSINEPVNMSDQIHFQELVCHMTKMVTQSKTKTDVEQEGIKAYKLCGLLPPTAPRNWVFWRTLKIIWDRTSVRSCAQQWVEFCHYFYWVPSGCVVPYKWKECSGMDSHASGGPKVSNSWLNLTADCLNRMPKWQILFPFPVLPPVR